MSFGSSETQILAAALRGLEAQREAAEHNIANIETPGFKARQVEFEAALATAMDDGHFDGRSTGGGPDGNPGPGPMRSSSFITTSLSGQPGRIDGSNVNLDEEVTGLELNALHQQLVVEALNARYTRLRTAIGRG